MTARAAEIRLRISKIMHDDRLNFRGKKIAAWSFTLHNELLNGTQFLVAQPGGQLYAVVVEDQRTRVMQIPKSGRGGERWFSYFNTMYGITEREDFNKFIYDNLRGYVLEQGTRVELRRFAAYDSMTQTAYLSGYNGRMYKIDGEDISDVAVGEDGVFFVDDDPGKHDLPDIGQHNMLFDRVVNQISFVPKGLSGITVDQQRKALIVWMFALAFPDLQPAKPILLVEGNYGSGKTSVVTQIQLVLMGIENSMILQRNKEDDFGVVLQRAPIALFDNTDSYIDWVPDAIAAYTTLGQWNKRKLFTDDENMIIKPHAFIAVTSRNPASFRREDVADRCVILHLERRATFTDVHELRQQMLADRPQLLGEYIWWLGKIVAELRRASAQPRKPEIYRMAGFAAFGRIVGRVLGWADEDVDKLMNALQGERDAFISEEDPLCDLLTKWIAYKPKQGPANRGRVMTANQLHSELESFALMASITWESSPRLLAQKLKSSQVERVFHIEKLTVQGQPAFRLWLHADTRLSLVEEVDQP